MRPRLKTIEREIRQTSYCAPCRKFLYVSKKAAKVIAKRTPTSQRLAQYRCPLNDQFWHNGKLNDATRRGET